MAIVPTIYLLLGVTTTITGPTCGIQGSGKKPDPMYARAVELNLTLDGQGAAATATVVVETSPDGTTWTTWGTFNLSSSGSIVGPSGKPGSPSVGSMAAFFARARVTAITGASPTITARLVVR